MRATRLSVFQFASTGRYVYLIYVTSWPKIGVVVKELADEFLTSGDIAKILDVSNQHVYWLVKQGRLPVASRTAGGIRLFRRSEIERIAIERKKSPSHPGRKASKRGPSRKKKGKKKTR